MTGTPSVLDRVAALGVVPVVVVDRPQDVLALVDVLEAAGLHALEITLRTPAALDAISLAVEAATAVLVGAGSVRTAEQVLAVRERGATFAVAPGLDPASVAAADHHDLPFVPGVVTPSEAMAALALGVRRLKFYPAVASGGIPWLRALAAPLDETVRFMPTGGIDATTAADWLALPCVFAVGGTWIAPRDDLRSGAWDDIDLRARAAVDLVATLRPPQRQELAP